MKKLIPILILFLIGCSSVQDIDVDIQTQSQQEEAKQRPDYIIYFDSNCCDIMGINKNNFFEIQKTRTDIKKNNIKEVTIIGYASIPGNEVYNKKLSHERALCVCTMLRENTKVNCAIIGAGETDEFGSYRKNRRVEIYFK